MCLLNWLFGKKKKNNTIPSEPYRVRRYYITKHCVEDMNKRQITKGDVYMNLTTRPIQKTKVKYDKSGRPSYRRSSKNKITTAINPRNKNVVSVNRLHTREFNKLMKGKQK